MPIANVDGMRTRFRELVESEHDFLTHLTDFASVQICDSLLVTIMLRRSRLAALQEYLSDDSNFEQLVNTN
jgi:hypothetical protein